MITVLLLLCAVSSLILAALVMARGKQINNVLFAGMAGCIAAWAVFILFFLSASTPDMAYLSAKGFYVSAAIFPAFLLTFAIFHPHTKSINKYLAGSIVGGSLSMIVPLLLVQGFIIDRSVISTSGNYIIIDPLTYFMFAMYFVIYFYAGITIAFRKFARYKGNEKIQAGAYAVGLFLNSIPGVITNLILPYYQNYDYIWVGPVGSSFFLGLTFYSIIRHKMFDIRFFVVRATAYLLTTLVLSILYVAPTIYLVAIVIMGFPFVPIKFLFGVLVATVAALSYNTIRHRFDLLTSKIFFRDSYDPQLFIANLNRTVVSNLDLESLLFNASKVITENFKSEYTLFQLDETTSKNQRIFGDSPKMFKLNKGPNLHNLIHPIKAKITVVDFIQQDFIGIQKKLQIHGIAVIAKLSVETDSDTENLGFILLGNKKSGQQYNTQDIQTLDTIIDGLIVAIQNAMRFEEIQGFNETLQQKVETATMKLRRTNAKLEALDESKDDFISMASHQLRTPLTAVKGYLSMVLEGDAGEINPVQKKMLNQAFMSSQRMVFLIADLLNVSRLKTGKFVIETAPINLKHLINEEVGQLRETAAVRGVKLNFIHPKSFPDLMLDETKTRQVVMNFVDNAIHYTPSGGKIDIELTEKPHTVELLVKDNGIGVPRSEQHHLFTKFYRAVNARRERPDGTGLGLFMAKKVVVAQGGAVVFNSKEGQGSTFGFTMPKEKLLVPVEK